MSMTRADLHLGSTVSLIEGTPWRIVVHWHHDGGQLVPAGIEVRCYEVGHEDPADFDGGQVRPAHDAPRLDGRSRAVSSRLLDKTIKWGQVLGDHAADLAQQLARDAEATSTMHPGSAEYMRGVAVSARGLTRATRETYVLVAALYREALEGPSRSRPAVYVLERLASEDYGYPLDPDIQSDRVKVRQWIGEARKRGHLPKATSNTTERKDSK